MATLVTWTREQESTGGCLAGSLLLHMAVVGLLAAWAFLGPSRGERWGENASTAGAIQASMVSALPLPPTQRYLEKGMLASDAPSPAPVTAKEVIQPPPKADEVPVQAKKMVAKVAEKPTPVAVKHPQPVPVQPTKATSGETAGIQIPEAMSIKLQNGMASVSVQDRTFGSRYAWYVQIINSIVAKEWYTAEADPRTSGGKRVTLLFDITREGAPVNVRVETRSGSPTLDSSALHAVQRVEGFGPLPAGDHLTVEYSFDYRQP
jgi:periplasmic protein TonB